MFLPESQTFSVLITLPAQQDLKRWTNLPLSRVARMAKTLPKMNFLFSVRPVTPTDNWFNSVESLVAQFYCEKKKPAISLPSSCLISFNNLVQQFGIGERQFLHYQQLKYGIKLKMTHLRIYCNPQDLLTYYHCV